MEAAYSEPAATMAREVEFHISQGTLAHALLQFSAQAGVPVSLDAGSAVNLSTSGLTGRRAISTALEELLRNSGLSYTIVGDTVTIIRIAGAAKPTDPDSPHTASAEHPGSKREPDR